MNNRAWSCLFFGLAGVASAACGGGNEATTGSGGSGGSASSSSSNGGTGGAVSSSSSGSGGASSSSSSASSASSSSSGNPGTGKWVSGYYAGYEQGLLPPSAIDWSGLTHIMIGRVTANPDGSLNTTFDIDAVNGPKLAKQLVQLAHQNGKKAVIMLGGAGEHAGWVSAAAAAHRAAFVQNLLALATAYGSDGFDLDWEPLDPADFADFQALAQALRTAAPASILTVPVQWVNANFPAVDPFYGTIAPIFDQINIMTYGMADGWDGWQSWHSSAIAGNGPTTPSSVDSSVQAYIAAGVPAAKVGIGIGFYGSCWSPPVSGPGVTPNGSSVVASDHAMSFANIMDDYYVAANHHYDATANAPWLGFPSAHGPEGCTFVSYEDEQSIVAKGAYATQTGIGGTIIWTINQGHRANMPAGQQDPLMQALNQGFLQ